MYSLGNFVSATLSAREDESAIHGGTDCSSGLAATYSSRPGDWVFECVRVCSSVFKSSLRHHNGKSLFPA